MPARDDGAATFRVAAEAYDRFVGRYSRRLAQAMVAEAGVGPGWDVLDVGCGPGALTAVLAETVGTGRVAAVDPSEPFAHACAERVPAADVQVGSGERLPFGGDSFDGVLSQLVVNFMADAPRGVGEMSRVARPGAVVAACVWDYADGMTLLRGFWDSAVALGLPGAAESDEKVRMRYCRPEDLASLWRSADLTETRVVDLSVDAAYESFEDLWSPLETGVGPAGSFTAGLADDDRARLRDKLRVRLGAPAGAFTLTARAWCAVGRAPGRSA